MSSTRTLGVPAELVQPVTSGAQPAAGVTVGPIDDIPVLAPLPQEGSRALVVTAPQKARAWWQLGSGTSKPPKATDEPYWPDVLRARAQLGQLRNRLNYVHANLSNAAWLGSLQTAAEIFQPCDAFRTSVVASLAGLKCRLDEGAAAGVRAALSGHSRQAFGNIAIELRAMDAERRPLEKTATELHAAIKASAAQAEKVKEEAARVTSLKLEEIKALHGEERERLTARIGQAFDAGYGFARYCHTAPGWKQNADHDALPANAVIPTLAMNGSVDFNQRFPGSNYLRFENWRRITSRAELEDLLDTLLGRDPTRSRE